MTAAQTMNTGSGALPLIQPSKNGAAAVSTATARPTWPAATCPTVSRPVIFQTTSASMLPPSSGRPGSRL